ncbi:MAG: hypothetical protein KKA79_07500 [Nanoarchaeota archaeon]|nr:hypothetical protein [Nanoarchaeota archaeon]
MTKFEQEIHDVVTGAGKAVAAHEIVKLLADRGIVRTLEAVAADVEEMEKAGFLWRPPVYVTRG